jgi:hypothetical protein
MFVLVFALFGVCYSGECMVMRHVNVWRIIVARGAHVVAALQLLFSSIR